MIDLNGVPEWVKKAVELHGEGLTDTEITRQIQCLRDVRRQTVAYWLRKLGLKANVKPSDGNDWHDDAVQLYRAGKSITGVATYLGMDYGAVWRALRARLTEKELREIQREHGGKSVAANWRQKAMDLYLRGMSDEMIADRVMKDIEVIAKWRKSERLRENDNSICSEPKKKPGQNEKDLIEASVNARKMGMSYGRWMEWRRTH